MATTNGDVQFLRSLMKVYPDFPKKGVNFLDIFPIFRNPQGVETLITHLLYHITSETIPRTLRNKIDVVVGLDARGFLLGPVLALRLGAAFVPVRKRGKLPGEVVTAAYEKEYGADIFEMQADAIAPGSTVLVIDDLIATGGSAKAAGELVAKLDSKVVEYLFIVELTFLKGTAQLDAPTYSIIQEAD